MTIRLPDVGGDQDNWGQVLNDFLSVAHNSDGTINASDISNGTLNDARLSTNVSLVANLPFVTIEQFGGKVNDTTVDNTTALLAAVASLTKGGVIVLQAGTYTFKTSAVFSTQMTSIKIVGKGFSDSSNRGGTMLNYTGGGFFLDFQNGIQYSELSSFTIICNNANGIRFTQGSGIVNQTKLFRVGIMGFIQGLDIQDFAYVWLEECGLNASINYSTANTGVQFGIRIGAGSGTREFCYLNKVSVDAGAGPSANDTGVTGNAVQIQDCNNVYIDNCDFSNWGSGKALSIATVNSFVFGIFVNTLNLTRCDGGIDIFSQSDYVTQVSLQNIMVVHRGASVGEVGVYVHRLSSFTLVGGIFDKMFFRKLGSTTPTYDINLSNATAKLGFYNTFSGAALSGITSYVT